MTVPPVPPAPPSRSAVALLADRVVRVIITTLGETRAEPMSAVTITETQLVGVAPRLVRDRIRDLERAGIVEAVGHERIGSTTRPQWQLTSAGRDLFSLLSVMSRVVTHATRLGPSSSALAREQLLQVVLAALADPVIVRVLRALGDPEPIDPGELERRCAPVPRRTIYRRLDTLVTGGVVLRHSSRQVPRRTTYELADRWRPVVVLLLLSAWWEWRHAPWVEEEGNVDLEGLVRGILPAARIPKTSPDSRVRWTLIHQQSELSFDVLIEDGKMAARPPATELQPDAQLVAAPLGWAAALVNDRRDDLQITGDETTANALLSAVRAALLAYVR